MTSRRPILIVEDDPDIADACRELLEDEGYLVWVAATGEEALRLLHLEERPCLVLLDLRLPDLEGEALIDEVERASPHAPPIVISTALRLRVPQRHQVLQKPYELTALLEIVRAHGCIAEPAMAAGV